MADKSKPTQGALEEEVWSAIGAFEQILEAIPNDRASLEALLHAYEQIGDMVRSKEYLMRLARVLIEEGDFSAAGELIERLKAFSSEDPEAEALVTALEQFGSGGDVSLPASTSAEEKALADLSSVTGEPVTEKKAGGAPVRVTFNISDELAFAWTLMESKELTQEEYASIVQDLTEMSTNDSASTISVLHVLEARGFKNIERVLAHVAKECDTPAIQMSNFNLTYEVVSILNPELMLKRGVFVFERIGQDLLVAIMNPYDKQLRKDLEAHTGKTCHFFTTLPSEFDKALTKAAEVILERQAQMQQGPA
ncbi:MAG: hypothetical protein A2498_05345 [Lentisphaerae bacterium RIFOXYC12_FULL_60_16]|nr:MAG: hypothetical protein A2498_05345 [Lentisphaerae bacterium RIFOXYC12_FULL_60_16]OGV86266.1 MAG: hypothetical protein A2340_01510 [Lentisphaerae bacterium RIFOXYB12_FULL_60_10]